jgi:CelD/BcsL family acetyltransferase involved in cellulose biosynthesis
MFTYGAQRKVEIGDAATARQGAALEGKAKSGEVLVLRPRAGAPSNAVAIRIGDNAWDLLNSPGFLLDWQELEAACPWATPYQSSHFVLTWLRHYRARFAPVVVTLRSPEGGLSGLLVLAASLERDQLVVAGAHQAEYHAWLATPESQGEFITRAISALDEVLPGHDLRFKYLPRGLSVGELFELPLFSARAGLETHVRPLIRLDAAEVRESLRKKSNKSRLARLQRLGPLAFARLSDPKDFADVFDEIIASYDARQYAMKGVLPFAQDPCKKPFHLELMRTRPEFLHVTATTLSGRVIAAHIGVTGREEVHLSILCHSDMHASHSPGKLHLLRLGELLLQEGKSVLDLTPGGDPWKERFANAHDEVYALTVFRSTTARRWHGLQRGAMGVLKGAVRTLGISPSGARRALVDFRRRWVYGGAPKP